MVCFVGWDFVVMDLVWVCVLGVAFGLFGLVVCCLDLRLIVCFGYYLVCNFVYTVWCLLVLLLICLVYVGIGL